VNASSFLRVWLATLKSAINLLLSADAGVVQSRMQMQSGSEKKEEE
jgi:hypothetical protein